MNSRRVISKRPPREMRRLQEEVESLRAQLAEAKETLSAIQSGEVDAVVVDSPDGQRIFTLQGADHAYRSLIEQMGEGAVTIKAGGAIDYCNRGFADMLARPLEQIIGTMARRYVAQADQPTFASLLHQAWASSVQGEVGLIAADGRVIPVQVGFSPLVDDSPGTSVSMVVTNLTERKQAERVQAARLLAEQATAVAEAASKDKDQFMAVLSHELRNPLNPVMATASMLREDARFDADTREQLDVILRNAKLAARLVDDLLEVTRIKRGKIELDRHRVDVCTIIRRAIDDCMPDIRAKKLASGADLGSVPQWVDADAGRLQQVFWNLLKNAVKFTPVGGRVDVRCHRNGDNFVVAEVSDSGEGIEADALARIFNAFDQGDRSITRQFGGLGLGLTISKAMVEMHGGTIGVQSAGKGKGATFTVRLPVADASMPKGIEPTAPIRTSELKKMKLRILLVEDHGDTALIMRRLLSGQGHDVQIAPDVTTAMQLAGEQTFDLLLSDMGLPDGTGLEFMRALRSKGIMWPGIALSGYGQESDIQQSREAGFAAHLVKPVNLARLKDEIARVAGTAARCVSAEPDLHA